MKTFDVLVISNTPLDSSYGASSSLRTHLDKLSESNFSYLLISPPSFNRQHLNKNHLSFSFLPWIYNYDGSPLAGFDIRSSLTLLAKILAFSSLFVPAFPI